MARPWLTRVNNCPNHFSLRSILRKVTLTTPLLHVRFRSLNNSGTPQRERQERHGRPPVGLPPTLFIVAVIFGMDIDDDKKQTYTLQPSNALAGPSTSPENISLFLPPLGLQLLWRLTSPTKF